MNNQELFVIRDSSNINVLDEDLYSYENAVFTLTPVVRERASNKLFQKIEQFIDSAPAIQKAADNVKNKTEYIPLISDEMKKLLQEGKAEIIPCKNNTDAFFLQIRSTVKGLMVHGKEYGRHKKIKDIPLSSKATPTDIVGAAQCLSMQSQLNQISDDRRQILSASQSNQKRKKR